MKLSYAVALVVFVLAGAITVSAQTHFGLPFPVTIGGKVGFMDANCRMVIPARYAEAMDFSEGLAAVEVGGKWGYIDEHGSLVIPPKFARAWFFSDGLASVVLDEQSALWGFIDTKGSLVIQPQFGMPLYFSEGLVEGYGVKDNVYNVPPGYVDKNGNYVIHVDEPGLAIQFLVGFAEGLARVSMLPKHADGSVGPSKYGFIDHSGKWVIPRSFAAADDFHEGLAAATGPDGTWGYIDKTGQFVIAPRFEAAFEFSEELAAVRLGGRWGWIDKRGVMVIPPSFEAEEVGVFRSGMATLARDRKVGYVNKKGTMIVPPTLDVGSEFVDGVALIQDRSSYKLIDTSGNVSCTLSKR